MFEWVLLPEAWVALMTLIALEIVLGIDNIVFISILVGKLPESQRNKARQFGIALALLTRLALLFSIVWVMTLVKPWFTVFGNAISGRDIILIAGGLFLLMKATHEIHNSLELASGQAVSVPKNNFFLVVGQIALLDIVFSLDSVITAVGLVDHVSIMVIAILVAIAVMLLSAKSIGEFIDNNPTFKMLALSFLMLIGVTLIAEGFDLHIPRGYIYFAMGYSIAVEILNMRIRKQKQTQAITLNKALS